MKKICIINYGFGNISSLSNSLIKIGFNPVMFTDREKDDFDVYFLPGVGAFPSAMEIINKKKIDIFLKKKLSINSMLFGICLGMQLMMSKSEEQKETSGLNLIEGKVRIISKKKIILPNVGWQKIKCNTSNKFFNFKHFNNEKFYFIHSYKAVPKNEDHILSRSNYENNEINSIINHKNFFGCQFHPEKSGEIGLAFLKNIIDNL